MPVGNRMGYVFFEILTLSLASVAQFSDVAIKESVNWDKPVIIFKKIQNKL